MFKITPKTIAADTGEASADAEVVILVNVIQDKIQDAVGHKLCEVIIELPVEFERLKDFTRKQAQLLVYGRLLQELDKAGYISNIMLYEQTTSLTVKWRSALGPHLEREMKEVVKKHLPKNPESSKTNQSKN